jgi:hypothetical protein
MTMNQLTYASKSKSFSVQYMKYTHVFFIHLVLYRVKWSVICGALFLSWRNTRVYFTFEAAWARGSAWKSWREKDLFFPRKEEQTLHTRQRPLTFQFCTQSDDILIQIINEIKFCFFDLCFIS